MNLRNKLKNQKMVTKSVTTALFMSAMAHAIELAPFTDEEFPNNETPTCALKSEYNKITTTNTPPPPDYKLNAKLSYGLGMETKATHKSLQRVNISAGPNIGIENGKNRVDFKSLFFISNNTTDESFDFFTSIVKLELGQKFGDGELIFSVGKMKHMDDVGSVNFGGGSVIMNDWLIDKNCLLPTDNTLKIGWKTPKSLIELGYVGTTNDHSLTFFDFNRMKNGQIVLVGAYNATEELKFKAAALTDEKKLSHLGFTSTYSKNGTIASIDLIYKLDDNRRNLVSVFTVNQKLSDSLNVFVQGAIDKIKGEKTGYKTLFGLQHNSGAYVYTGMERDSGSRQDAAVLGIGFKLYGDKNFR